MKVETVEVNGVIVNVGDEETAAKWAKKEVKAEAKSEEDDKPKGKKKPE
jgi:hypothetical protein